MLAGNRTRINRRNDLEFRELYDHRPLMGDLRLRLNSHLVKRYSSDLLLGLLGRERERARERRRMVMLQGGNVGKARREDSNVRYRYMLEQEVKLFCLMSVKISKS